MRIIRGLPATMLSLALLPIFMTDASAHPAWGIAVDRQGQIFFSDLKRVWKIDAQGKLSLVRAEGDRHTHDLSVDEAGNLYGADNSYEPATQRFFGALWRRTPAGDFSYLLPLTEDLPEGTSVLRDRDGNMYHVGIYQERDLVVLKRGPSGNVTVLYGSPVAAREYRQGAPYSLGGTAFGPDGALYFIHGANISKVTMGGKLTALARNLLIEKASGNRAGANSPTPLLGLAVDAQSNVFAADHGNRRVIKITPSGQTSAVMRTEEQWYPAGVVERGGELYILEHGETPRHIPIGTRVKKILPDGKVITLATVGASETSQGSSPAANGSSANSSERGGGPQRNIPYAIIGTGLSVIALTIIAWLLWRRRYDRQHGSV